MKKARALYWFRCNGCGTSFPFTRNQEPRRKCQCGKTDWRYSDEKQTLPDLLKVEIGSVTMTVRTAEYIADTTRRLREFGYPKLTEDTVRQQLGNVLVGQQLNVIGEIISREVVKA